MPDRVVVDRIDFREALVFPRVFASAVGALQPPRILLATFALLCLIVVGRAYDVVRGPSVQPAGLLATSRTSVDSAVASDVARRVAREALPMDRRPAGADGFGGRVNVEEVRSALLSRRGEVSGTELEAVQRAIERLEPFRGKGAFDALSTAIGSRFDALVGGVMTLDMRAAAAALGDLLLTIPVAMWREDWIFAIFYLIAGGMTLGLLGAAIARMAALDLGKNQRISPVQALTFVWQRPSNHALVPLWPATTLLVLLPVALVLGLLGRVPGLDVLAGAAYGLALFFGTLATVVLLPWLLAMPMAIAASACEGCDGLEAAQRCGAMVYRRPLHALLYVVCAIVAIALTAFVVDLVATVAIELTASFMGLSAGSGAMANAGGARLLAPDAMEAAPAFGASVTGSLQSVSVGLVRLWQGILQSLAAGAVFGAICTTATAAYLAMRRTCDEQPFDDLWEPGAPAGVRAASADHAK